MKTDDFHNALHACLTIVPHLPNGHLEAIRDACARLLAERQNAMFQQTKDLNEPGPAAPLNTEH